MNDHDGYMLEWRQRMDREDAEKDAAKAREVEAQRDDFRLKFLTLKSFISRHFEEDCGICVHTWCPYHKEGVNDFCSAPAPGDMVRENCYRTFERLKVK